MSHAGSSRGAVESFPPSPVPVDLESLLLPISEEAPCGTSLRYEGTYDRILEGRRSERTDLPQGVWKTELKTAEWDEVETLAIDALQNRTKDVQIALWLTEAWLNRWGFGGYRHGLDLISALCERYWPDLHPEIRDGDVDYRVAPFVWLAENLSSGLNSVPITWPRTYDELPRCTYADWQSALRLEKLEIQAPEAFENEIANGRLTRDRFSASARDSVPMVVVDTYGQLRAAAAALNRVDDMLDVHCAREAPSLRKPKTLLKEVLAVYEQTILPALGLNPKSVRAHGLVAPPAAAASQSAASPTHGYEPSYDDEDAPPMESAAAIDFGTASVEGRAQAYRMLAEIADYLQRIEPHSPTPYLVRRAAGWENKTLLELMQELLQNPQEVQGLYQFLGIPFNAYGQ